MNIYDPAHLEAHIRKTMAFYHPRCIDTHNGFFHYLRDDGRIDDPYHRHLVSSTRYVVIYSRYAMYFGEPEYLHWARHGLAYLEKQHFQPRYQGYAWTLNTGEVEDDTNHCYGLAFVMLAYAEAFKAGISEAKEGLYRVHELQTRRFWEPQWQLYADDADSQWRVSDYRGQNANMHSCEALIAAFEATADERFIERASLIANAICRRQARQRNGWIWEHYDSEWRADFEYNRHDPKHLFRPWGFQPGHQTEWAKLLVVLARYRNEAWLIPTACELFLSTVAKAWHPRYGGLVYGLDLDSNISDGDKHFWVQAESLAAAAMLGECTGDRRFWCWYERIWEFSLRHMIDHRYGAWYRILTPDNRAYTDLKSPAGKVDYHTMGACYDMIEALRRCNGVIDA